MRNKTEIDLLLDKATLEAPLNYKGKAKRKFTIKGMLIASLAITALFWLPISVLATGASMFGLVILPTLFLGSTLLTAFNLNRHLTIKQTKSRRSLSALMDAVEKENFYLTDWNNISVLANVIQLFEATTSYQDASLKERTTSFCTSHATSLSRAILTKTLEEQSNINLSLLKFSAEHAAEPTKPFAEYVYKLFNAEKDLNLLHRQILRLGTLSSKTGFIASIKQYFLAKSIDKLSQSISIPEASDQISIDDQKLLPQLDGLKAGLQKQQEILSVIIKKENGPHDFKGFITNAGNGFYSDMQQAYGNFQAWLSGDQDIAGDGPTLDASPDTDAPSLGESDLEAVPMGGSAATDGSFRLATSLFSASDPAYQQPSSPYGGGNTPQTYLGGAGYPQVFGPSAQVHGGSTPTFGIPQPGYTEQQSPLYPHVPGHQNR